MPSGPDDRSYPPDPGELRLAEGLAAGDPAAVSEFLERTHHPVFWMACRLTRDPEQRQDWAHEVLLGVIDDLARGRFAYRHPGSFWAWFRKRAHFRLLDAYRRQRRDAQREMTVDDRDDAPGLDAFAGGEDPADVIERVELRAVVERCLDRLANPEQARALTLRLLEDHSYEDVAGAMRAPLNTVRAWIRRGRIALRRCLEAATGAGVAAPEGTPATSARDERSSSSWSEP
jgi:RNA polymerase sigma-70 factor (ECF subfamily)